MPLINNSDLANMPAMTAKANLTNAATSPQDVPLSNLAAPGNPLGDAIAGRLALSGGSLTGPTTFSGATVYALGLVPSGGGDQSATINALLASVPGARIILPKGTYDISSLTVPPQSTLEGQGEGATILRRINSAPTPTSQALISYGSGSVLRGFTIDGNKGNQTHEAYGCLGYRTVRAAIEDVTVSDNYGISFGAPEGYLNLYNRAKAYRSGAERAGFYNDFYTAGYEYAYNKYLDCISIDNDLDGLSLGQHGCTVRGGQYNGNGRSRAAPSGIPGPSGAIGAAGIYGVDTKTTDDTLIDGVAALGNLGFGIEIALVRGMITQCRVGQSGLSGILLRNRSSRTHIISNICCYNGANPTISNPTLWGKAGIQFDDSGFCKIEGNSCYDDRSSGQTQKFGIQFMRQHSSPKMSIIGNGCSYNSTDNDNVNPALYSTFQSNLPNMTYANNS